MVRGSDIREGAKWYAKGWGIALLSVFSILALGLVITLATGTLQKWTADFRGDVKVKEQTKANAGFRIGSYDSFFDLCSSVQSSEDAIRNAEDEIAAKETTDERKAKLRQVITAQKNTRAESVRDYNSKAGNELRGAFKDAGLPARLDINTMDTECKL